MGLYDVIPRERGYGGRLDAESAAFFKTSQTKTFRRTSFDFCQQMFFGMGLDDDRRGGPVISIQ